MKRYNPETDSDLFHINIGTIIFFIIFIYVIIRIIISIQSETLSVYEVQNSYIDTNINCTALILRSETIVDTDSSGYVSYYVRDGEKVGKNKTVYTIDETGSVYDKIKDSNSDALAITDEGLSEVRTRISNYENYFDYSSFSDVYNFKYDIENAVLELTNEAMIDQLTTLDNSATNVSTYKKVNSNEAGIITYYKDGYENTNIDNFKASDVNSSGYKKTTLKTGEIINSGDPVYKLITSENWYLIAPLNDKQAEALADKENIAINIHNSSKNIYCPISFTKKDNKTFAIISLNQQMVNYINERFIDIVIIMDQNNGLKLPNSAITEKSVFKVPVEYLSNGSDSMDKRFLNIKVLDEKGEVSIKQISANIYKITDKDVYIDPNDFAADATLVNINSNESLPLSSLTKEKLKGVYCVNQGIATFRYIDILYQDDEYTIVSDNTPYSIALYDRIILNHSMVKENQIIK